MSPATVALVATLSVIGYLLIGWVTTVVLAAVTAVPRRSGGVTAETWVYCALVAWPPIWLGGVLYWLGVRFSAVTLRAVRRLNPDVEKWDLWDS